ncbi:MAG: hypothetical protein ACRC0M_08650 [Legionella sp.]
MAAQACSLDKGCAYTVTVSAVDSLHHYPPLVIMAWLHQQLFHANCLLAQVTELKHMVDFPVCCKTHNSNDSNN